MVRQLDRSRPYGEVHGAPGIAFVQGDWLFDHQGQEANANKHPTWKKLLVDPDLAQQELTRQAAATTTEELSSLPYAEVKRIAQDEYLLRPGRASKIELIRKIHDRIMEQPITGEIR
ncbi:MAG: hypothetical protein HQL77_13860 [Magnetococcales bacterium]|nr:hypothetical protein [Magnetococcales bacterium]